MNWIMYNDELLDIWETIPDPDAEFEDKIEREESIENGLDALHNALEKLEERQRWVIDQRYTHNRPLRELSVELGVTIQRVHTIEKQALLNLRKMLEPYREDCLAAAYQ